MAFRRNRSKPGRVRDWKNKLGSASEDDLEVARTEQVVAKGDLSRHRTIIVDEEGVVAKQGSLHEGVVVSVLGLYAEVDKGSQIVRCTVRRVLRTRLIEERHPVTVGDRVQFSLGSSSMKLSQGEQSEATVQDGLAEGGMPEGVIESVAPSRGKLQRLAHGRVHTIAANVDQAIIVTSAAQPRPKPQLIDRYIVASLHGEIEPIVCLNKVDLDEEGVGQSVLQRYAALGHQTLRTSVISGEGISGLAGLLCGKSSVIAGQSGVGKSSLLNAVQPGLNLKTSEVSHETEKGKHTTTTACLLRLEGGGYVVDTPGIRTFDISTVPVAQIEAYFVEFIPRIPHCKYPDCSHIHEQGCAVLAAVEAGDIHPDRYESYVRLFEERAR